MKILAIGDPHGKIPKLGKILRNEHPDVIVCTGDFGGDDRIRNLIFKNWGKPWYFQIGKKKAKEMVRQSEKKGRAVLKYLNSLKIPVYAVPGNYDDEEKLKKVIKHYKNIHFSHLKKFKIGDYYFVFHGGYMDAKIFFTTNVLKNFARKKERRKENDAEKKKLTKIFKKTKGKIIFITHIPAYGLFDKVKNKKSPMDKKHVGIEAYEYIIKKYKPQLYICGHMHENQGVKKTGNTTAVCLGEAKKHVYLIDINEKIKISKLKIT